MTDESWTNADDAAFSFESLGDDHPVRRASVFLMAVTSGEYGPDVLGKFVTPETLSDWGDFSKARADLLAIDSPGVGTTANRAHGADDVVYVKVLSDVQKPEMFTEPTPMMISGVFTLVWRPELDAWLIHRFGEYALPEHLPRTSPGRAPAV